MPKFNCILAKGIKHLNFHCLSTNIGISRSTRFYANFSIEEIGSGAGPLLKCLNLSSEIFNQFET